MPPVPVPIAEAKPPQPTRYAIQKARGSGWKTLEVGEELPTTQARFDAMVKVNPRAYFRLIQLDERENSHFEGMEFNWKLIQLYDPSKSDGASAASSSPVRQRKNTRSRRHKRYAKERVALPWRFYATVVVIGLLIGALVYLRYGLSG